MSINGGDAAEQMVHILLDGTERAVRIVGDGAKNLAAFLYAWTRASSPGQERPGSASGKTNLSRLLRSGQELHVFRLRPEEYAAFRPEARTFRLLYAALRNKKDPEGCIDLIVRADAIPRVNHIFERIGYAQLPGQGGAHIAASAARESKKKLRHDPTPPGKGANRRPRRRASALLLNHALSRGPPCAKHSNKIGEHSHIAPLHRPEKGGTRHDDPLSESPSVQRFMRHSFAKHRELAATAPAGSASHASRHTATFSPVFQSDAGPAVSRRGRVLSRKSIPCPLASGSRGTLRDCMRLCARLQSAKRRPARRPRPARPPCARCGH